METPQFDLMIAALREVAVFVDEEGEQTDAIEAEVSAIKLDLAQTRKDRDDSLGQQDRQLERIALIERLLERAVERLPHHKLCNRTIAKLATNSCTACDVRAALTPNADMTGSPSASPGR